MENFKSQPSIEQSANYEGNDGLLLFSRLHNPAIKSQLIDFMYLVESESKKEGEARNREEIESDLDTKIAKIENSTEIAFASLENHPFHTAERMIIGYIDPITNSSLTEKQTSMVEAHEKGHVVRNFSDDEDKVIVGRRYLSTAFDASGFRVPESELEFVIEQHKDSDEPLDLLKFKEQYISYLLHPEEVFERMSQLKNYFGFSGDEIFTIEHLNYAREHYVEDVGIDNGMSPFLSLITIKTEQEFIRIINSIGV